MAEELRIRLSEGGRIAIPAEYQHALGIRPGDELLLRLEDDQVRISILKENHAGPLHEADAGSSY